MILQLFPPKYPIYILCLALFSYFIFIDNPNALAINLGNIGTFKKWSKVEIVLKGPNSKGMGNPNPFKIKVDVTFAGPGGTFKIPGFYDGDGAGGMDGNIWKARFSPNATGTWSFVSRSFEPQTKWWHIKKWIQRPFASNINSPLLDDYQGTFTVEPPDLKSPNFNRWGLLAYIGKHYLKFADGPYWLKGGSDDPENILGPGVMGNWEEKKRSIDYLASKGVNSLYIMTNNVDGDGDDVWPWVPKYDSEHFDLSKLADWEDFFTYMQEKGVVIHLVLEDDSGWTGFDRCMYYRELVARFSHYNGLIWNISEEYEENYESSQIKAFAQMIRDLDPYDHPITVHGLRTNSFKPFVGNSLFDITSFQTDASMQNNVAINWRKKVSNAGRPIVISFDETGKITHDMRIVTRNIVWSIYMGGGNLELHTWPIKSFQQFEDIWNDMRYARLFMESVPFWEMLPENSLLKPLSNNYCFRKQGEIYTIYLKNGGSISIDLTGQSGQYTVKYYNPTKGEYLIKDGGDISGGGWRTLPSPPFAGDAAILIEKTKNSNTNLLNKS